MVDQLYSIHVRTDQHPKREVNQTSSWITDPLWNQKFSLAFTNHVQIWASRSLTLFIVISSANHANVHIKASFHQTHDFMISFISSDMKLNSDELAVRKKLECFWICPWVSHSIFSSFSKILVLGYRLHNWQTLYLHDIYVVGTGIIHLIMSNIVGVNGYIIARVPAHRPDG